METQTNVNIPSSLKEAFESSMVSSFSVPATAKFSGIGVYFKITITLSYDGQEREFEGKVYGIGGGVSVTLNGTFNGVGTEVLTGKWSLLAAFNMQQHETAVAFMHGDKVYGGFTSTQQAVGNGAMYGSGSWK